MKRLWISAAIIITLAGVALTNVWYLDQFVARISLMLQQAQQSMEQDDLERASRLTRQAWEEFDQQAFYLHVTLSHQEIDAVEISFSEVSEYLRLQEPGGEYAAANARLLSKIYLLAEAEQFTVKNVL